MSNMNGNPHYEDYQLDLANAGQFDQQIMQTHATLALVYEQRTANLIAIHSRGSVDLTNLTEKQRDEWVQMAHALEVRLGVAGD